MIGKHLCFVARSHRQRPVGEEKELFVKFCRLALANQVNLSLLWEGIRYPASADEPAKPSRR